MRIEWIEKYLLEAEQLVYNNQVNEGIALLQGLLYDEPGYGYLHNHLGWAYLYYTEDIVQAELHLKMAIKFEGDYAAPYIHMGRLMIRCQRYVEAIDYLTLGLQKPSANRVVFLEAMGQAWELRGDYRQAIKMYREAMMTSLSEQDVTNMNNNVNRCRKKRWAGFWKV